MNWTRLLVLPWSNKGLLEFNQLCCEAIAEERKAFHHFDAHYSAWAAQFCKQHVCSKCKRKQRVCSKCKCREVVAIVLGCCRHCHLQRIRRLCRCGLIAAAFGGLVVVIDNNNIWIASFMISIISAIAGYSASGAPDLSTPVARKPTQLSRYIHSGCIVMWHRPHKIYRVTTDNM